MKLIDLTGRRFGKLTVVRLSRRVRLNYQRPTVYALWECVCDCGQSTECKGEVLRTGALNSCGCLRGDLFKRKHGMTESPEYRIWTGMLTRCRNPHSKSFKRYGAVGISVCERWSDFTMFLQDMGPRPTQKHSIDRIDGTKGYAPGNCRWATTKEQCSNQQRNIRVAFNGKTQTLKQWSEELGIAYGTLQSRRRAGWTVERLLAAPVGRCA